MPKKTSKKSKTVKKAAAKKTSPKKVAKKVEAPVAAPLVPVAPPLPPVQSVSTEAERIWNEIKNRPIEMFGLPDQFVFQHATFVNVEPSALYVTIRSTATLPSLEVAVGPDFLVEMVDKFVVVKRKPKPLIPTKKR